MFNDFKMKHPDFICSYELYRQEVKKMNISFAQLGGEECFTCWHLKSIKKTVAMNTKLQV
nr:unnamed protein product [Callosobruchus analis]